MSNEMLEVLDQVYANANRLVSGVGEDQWELQTPCSEWNVRELVNHMVGTSNVCVAAATRGERPSSEDNIGDDPVGAFAAAGAAAMEAWRGDGALDGEVSVPADMPAIAALGVNIIDLGTHVWDLATAVGQDHGLSDSAVAMIDEWNRRVIQGPVREGGGFGEDLGPKGDALASMLAFVGREAG